MIKCSVAGVECDGFLSQRSEEKKPQKKQEAADSTATGLMSNNKEDLGGEASGCGGAVDGEQTKAGI